MESSLLHSRYIADLKMAVFLYMGSRGGRPGWEEAGRFVTVCCEEPEFSFKNFKAQNRLTDLYPSISPTKRQRLSLNLLTDK